MRYGFIAELRRLVGFGCIALIVGLIIDQFMLAVMVFCVLYMAWTLANIYLLDQWLTQRKKTVVPDASGIWGDIFYNLSYAEKRTQRQQQRLKTVFNRMKSTTTALNDGLVLLNSNGCIDWWNQAAKQMLVFKSIDKGSPIINYIRHPEFARYLSADKHDLPLDLSSQHYPERQLQYQITRFGEDECLLTVRDITRIHKLETMRKDFVANVSHELRTPLTVIRGYLETFTDVDYPDPLWRKGITQMLQQANHMTELIDDFTMLSKLETDNIENTQTSLNLTVLLNKVIDVAKAYSNGGHTFGLSGAEGIWIMGNEKELHSAFSNLLINAVSYSPIDNTTSCKPITITVAIDRMSRLRITFADQGIGIARQHLSRLTERFYRVDSSRAVDISGTGLGLAIVKHVLLRHEATLDITSKLGKGSEFTCLFSSHKLSVAPHCKNDSSHP